MRTWFSLLLAAILVAAGQPWSGNFASAHPSHPGVADYIWEGTWTARWTIPQAWTLTESGDFRVTVAFGNAGALAHSQGIAHIRVTELQFHFPADSDMASCASVWTEPPVVALRIQQAVTWTTQASRRTAVGEAWFSMHPEFMVPMVPVTFTCPNGRVNTFVPGRATQRVLALRRGSQDGAVIWSASEEMRELVVRDHYTRTETVAGGPEEFTWDLEAHGVCPAVLGRVMRATGRARINGETVRMNQRITEGMVLETGGGNSSLEVLFADLSTLTVQPSSRVQVTQLRCGSPIGMRILLTVRRGIMQVTGRSHLGGYMDHVEDGGQAIRGPSPGVQIPAGFVPWTAP